MVDAESYASSSGFYLLLARKATELFVAWSQKIEEVETESKGE